MRLECPSKGQACRLDTSGPRPKVMCEDEPRPCDFALERQALINAVCAKPELPAPPAEAFAERYYAARKEA